MTDAPPPPSTPQTPPPRRKRTNPLLLLLMGIIPVAAIGAALYFVQVRKPLAEHQDFNNQLVHDVLGLGGTEPLRLNAKFTDADGDLVADAPADAQQLVDPPTLRFSYVATNEPEDRYRERFKEFTDYLTSQLGRPVEYVLFKSPEDELRAIQNGELHIAGINTGNIPLAVSECGFVPVCGLASEQKVTSYQMMIIVPADSRIRTVLDLKGGELTLTEPGSNSGFKAPLVLLSKDHKLEPGRDFALRYSQGHRQSIEGIANKTFQAAAVASDVLQRATAEDPPLIGKEQYRVIYTSENFPTAGFGYVWNLKPDLAAKVKDAFFKFEWKGTGVEKEFGASNQTKFVPVSFKDDFALVRRIDDAIRSIRASTIPAIDDPPAPATTTTADATASSSAPATRPQ